MTDRHRTSQPACTGCATRREFLASCAAGMAVASLGTPARLFAAENVPAAKAKVRLVFTHLPSNIYNWPEWNYDFDARKKELVEQFRQSCPDIEFLPATAMTVDEAKKIVEQDKDQSIDGNLVYMVGMWVVGAPTILAETGKPTVFVDELFSGSGNFLVELPAARRKGLKVVGVASSRFDDVIQAANYFACLKKMQAASVLVLNGDPNFREPVTDKTFGTKLVPVTFEQLEELYQNVDRTAAAEWADRWMREAEKVVEPSRNDIEDCGAMYLAMRELLAQQQAQAITINCLGGFSTGKIHAYPCLGFLQMNNDGGVAACEADVNSTLSMLLMNFLGGVPGFISDPVIDTAKNQIVYAHCVAPSKVFGPEGPSNPYHIRNHAEDRKGVAIKSLMPSGHMTTTMEFLAAEEKMLMHHGMAVGNVEMETACRSKLAVEVEGDLRKLMNNWSGGWHRVTFYGDWRYALRDICDLTGIQMVEEA